MSKKILFAVMIALFIQSCNRDDKNSSKTGEKEVESLAEQNTNDDKAIEKYLDEHYLNSQGVVTKFDKTDTRDDNEKKLSDLNPKKLENGIIIIKREKAQPANGKTIGATDIFTYNDKNADFSFSKGGIRECFIYFGIEFCKYHRCKWGSRKRPILLLCESISIG